MAQNLFISSLRKRKLVIFFVFSEFALKTLFILLRKFIDFLLGLNMRSNRLSLLQSFGGKPFENNKKRIAKQDK